MTTKFGQAKTDAEKKLENAVSDINEWHNKTISYEPVNGGISNANWKIIIENTPVDYFLKIPGEGTEMFVDRQAANDASVKAHQVGVGAKVVHFDPDTGIEVFEFIDGYRASTNGDFDNETVRLNGLHALKKFNDAPALNLKKTIMDMVEEHNLQMLQLGAYFPQDFEWLNANFVNAKKALIASGLDLVPCMNDTLAGNFLLDAQNNIMLVDFEYASNNDRCAELAVWFGEMFFEPDVELQLIEEYFGKFDKRLETRITVYKALADIKWASWAMVQNQISVLDFDYFKYGIWKYMRARTVMKHPDWQSWLNSL